MFSKKFSKIFLLLLLLSSIQVSATRRTVLFVGNSYIYTNSMPDMLQALATAMGDTMVYDQSTPGGHTFENHTTNTTTISKIYSQPWDIVVLQEQSQRPSFPPSQVATDVYPYARKLDSMIHDNDTCTQTMFLMTWGRANGDAMNCPFYPVVCTYAGMQSRLRESYMEMTEDNNAIVGPAGAAWKVVKDSFPGIDLFSADSSHPSVAGSYLEACVLYSSIYHKRTFGTSYLGGLTSSVARTLQRISDKVVLDSLAQWQLHGHYPNAGFSHTLAGPVANFATYYTIPSTHNWWFGDGAIATGASPSHTYSGSGTFVVTHAASNDCFTITMTDTIRVGTTATSNMAFSQSNITVTQTASQIAEISVAGDKIGDMLTVYDMLGRKVAEQIVTSVPVLLQLQPAMYVYRISNRRNFPNIAGKFVISY